MQKQMNETKGLLQRIHELYGPYAFGVVSLLIVWFAIVKPELDNRTLDLQAQSEILKQLAEQTRSQMEITHSIGTTAETMRATAETMRTTAAVLEQTVGRLSDT